MLTRYHVSGRYASTARMAPEGCHAPADHERNGLPVRSSSGCDPSSANIITGRSPDQTKPLPSQTCIHGGLLLSESTTTFRWWWIQVLTCGRGAASTIASQ